jgi:hypothetical protein
MDSSTEEPSASYWTIDDSPVPDTYAGRVPPGTIEHSTPKTRVNRKKDLKTKKKLASPELPSSAPKRFKHTGAGKKTSVTTDTPLKENTFMLRATNTLPAAPKPATSTLDDTIIDSSSQTPLDLAKTSAGQTVADGDCTTGPGGKEKIWSLGFGRQVRLCEFEGEPRIDIRLWGGPAKDIPTTKGVSLNFNRYKALTVALTTAKDVLGEFAAKKRVEKWSYHLGGDIYASINKDYLHLDLRRFFRVPNNASPLPTRKGITLRPYQVNKLLDLESAIEKHSPQLKTFIPCFMKADHDSETIFFECKECCPGLVKSKSRT